MKLLPDFDKALLNEMQHDFPLTERPFDVLAKKLNSNEETIIAHARALMDAGYIKRIGAYFDSAALGYRGSLVALKVSDGFMESVASEINSYDTITHNYEREGEYNLWFTLQVHSEEERKKILDDIASIPGVEKLINMNTEKTYKVRVEFKL